MSSSHSVSSSLAWNVVRTWGSRLAGFIIFFQLTRYLGPSEMGLFAAAFAVMTLFDLIVDQGLMSAIIQRSEPSSEELNTVFALNVGAGIALTLGAWTFRDQIERLMGVEGISSVVAIASLALIFGALSMCQEALNRKALNFKKLATRTLIATTVSGAVGVYLAATGHGVYSLVAQFVIAAVCNFLLIWWRPIWVPSLRAGFCSIRSYFKVSSGAFGVRLLDYSGTRGVDLLVGSTLGVAQLGFFSVGTKLQYIALQLVGTAIVDVAFPVWSRDANDKRALAEKYLETVRLAATFSLPIWLVLAIFSSEMCLVAFGTNWVEAGGILKWMAVVGFAQLSMQFDVAAITALGKGSTAFGISVLRVFFPIALAAFFGAESASDFAFWLAAGNLAIVPASSYMVCSMLGLPVVSLARAYKVALVAAAGACGVILMVYWLPYTPTVASAIIRLGAGAAIFCFTYGAIVLWVDKGIRGRLAVFFSKRLGM